MCVYLVCVYAVFQLIICETTVSVISRYKGSLNHTKPHCVERERKSANRVGYDVRLMLSPSPSLSAFRRDLKKDRATNCRSLHKVIKAFILSFCWLMSQADGLGTEAREGFLHLVGVCVCVCVCVSDCFSVAGQGLVRPRPGTNWLQPARKANTPTFTQQWNWDTQVLNASRN